MSTSTGSIIACGFKKKTESQEIISLYIFCITY